MDQARVNLIRLRQVFIGSLLACPLLDAASAAAFYYPLAFTLAESVTPENGTGLDARQLRILPR